jgi:predicted RNA-binding protein YlxR (DUF448 family)/ribosomal protein L7Ae-like RNA K-turn-binding protein
VGCGRTAAPDELLRVVLGSQVDDAREIAVDVAGGSFGRGAHVHPKSDCLAKACKSGLARSFKCKVSASLPEICAQIVDGYDRRIAGLLVGGRRAGHLAVGADQAASAMQSDAPLLVVASDAGTVVDKGFVARAVAEGRAVVWKNKVQLGTLLGRDEVSVVAVTNEAIAEQIQRARSRSEACRSREVR